MEKTAFICPPKGGQAMAIELNTSRLRILELTCEQLELFACNVPQLEEALGLSISGYTPQEDTTQSVRWLLDRVSACPQDAPWYSLLLITQRQSNTIIGTACCIGPPNKKNEVEVGYTLCAQHRGQGYMTEALGVITGELLRKQGVKWVTARCEPDNAASVRVLEKLDFSPVQSQDGLLHFRKRREQKTAPVLICMVIGTALGGIANLFLNHLSECLYIGLLSGMAVGFLISRRRSK